METIEHNGKEYTVTDRADMLISEYTENSSFMEDIAVILESKNYKEGKISEPIMLAALLDIKYAISGKEWIQLLTSEVFATGLISYDIASKLIDLILRTEWHVIDEKYKKGIIKDEHLKNIFEIISSKDEDCLECEPLINIMLTILTSEAYEKGNITDKTIKLLSSTIETLSYETPKLVSPTSEESSYKKYDILYEKYDILRELLNENNIPGNSVNDKMLKSIIESKYLIVDKIIYYIITSKKIKPEEKDYYILAMLNMKNHESLSNVYNCYIEEKKVASINEFAKNFVLYTLSLYEYVFQGSYTKKREKK